MRVIKVISITSMTCLALLGCGGGGDSSYGEDCAKASSYTYFTSGGLTWASLSQSTCPFGTKLQGFTGNPSFYCTGQTNGQPSNFNKQAGWRLPELAQLVALYNSAQRPASWAGLSVWALAPVVGASSGVAKLDFSSGQVTYGDGGYASVTCVK